MYKSKVCAYCGNKGDFSNEHVFPDFFDQLFTKNWVTRQRNIQKLHLSPPTIKDVCKTCNNGKLSELDNYGKEITKKYFQNFINSINDSVEFKYNYNLLIRWLLKVTYNGSRAFALSYSEYQEYIPFILGKSNIYPKTSIFLGIMKSGNYAGEDIEPNNIAIGSLKLQYISFKNINLIRTFYIRSYVFVIISWNKKVTEDEINRFKYFLKDELGCDYLSPNNDRIKLNLMDSKMDYISYKRQITREDISLTEMDIERFSQKLPDLKKFKFNK